MPSYTVFMVDGRDGSESQHQIEAANLAVAAVQAVTSAKKRDMVAAVILTKAAVSRVAFDPDRPGRAREDEEDQPLPPAELQTVHVVLIGHEDGAGEIVDAEIQRVYSDRAVAQEYKKFVDEGFRETELEGELCWIDPWEVRTEVFDSDEV